jgi:hypothetical protein
MFATAVIEHYCEAFPEKAKPLGWFLVPTRRHTLLTELGRIARPRSDGNGELSWDEAGISRMIDAALELAEARPSTRSGITTLRSIRAAARPH